MANRTLPFGYRMRSGNITVVEDEAEIVRMIFASHAEGSSYEKLASGLNSRDIPFSPGRLWNKNAVARLLQDKRYLGNDTYPPIVALDEFGGGKADAGGRREHPEIKDVRILAQCAACGGPVRRERQNTWRCPHCMAEAVHTTDRRLMDATSELLNALREAPNMVRFTPGGNTETSASLTCGTASLKNWTSPILMKPPQSPRPPNWPPLSLTRWVLKTTRPCGYSVCCHGQGRGTDWIRSCSAISPPPFCSAPMERSA